MAWIALGFGIWLTAGLVLVLWALEQGVADHPFASVYHWPVYLGLVTLCGYSAVRLIRALRAGRGWRATYPPGYGLLGVGAALAVITLVTELGWREGIGIAPGIEENLAPTRTAIGVALILIAITPLRAARLLDRGQVPRLAMLLSAGLVVGLIGVSTRFHPVLNSWFEEADAPVYAPGELWVMESDGSRQTRLVETSDPTIGYGYASWTPDGAMIVYSRFHTPEMDETRSDSDIWAVNADGSNPRLLVGGEGMQWIPKVSPDGARVAYTQEEVGGPWANAGPIGPGPGAGPGGGAAVGPLTVPLANADLWQAAANGSGDAPRRLSDSSADDRAPVYSPDGAAVLFDSTRDGNTELYLLDLATGDERRLTDSPGEDWGASWSPDGTLIAFNSDRSGVMDIYVMAADGSDVRRLTSSEPNVGALSPSWSPDGSRIVYTERIGDGGPGEIWSVAVAGGEPRNLTRSAVTADEAWTGAWGPDDRIVFSRSQPGPAEAGFLAREDLGSAAMLLSAALMAMVVVAVIQAGWALGSFTLLLSVAVFLIVLPVEAWRFLVVGPAVGLAIDLALLRTPSALHTRVAGAVAGAAMVLALGLVVVATSRLGWSPTLLLGAAVAAAAIGWGVGAIGGSGRRDEVPA